jgi:hypothetical protein
VEERPSTPAPRAKTCGFVLWLERRVRWASIL